MPFITHLPCLITLKYVLTELYQILPQRLLRHRSLCTHPVVERNGDPESAHHHSVHPICDLALAAGTAQMGQAVPHQDG